MFWGVEHRPGESGVVVPTPVFTRSRGNQHWPEDGANWVARFQTVDWESRTSSATSSCMHRIGVCLPEIGTGKIAARPELRPTLWHCHRCAARIAIYSAEIIELATCPICCDVTLDPRGSFETILGITWQERSPAAS